MKQSFLLVTMMVMSASLFAQNDCNKNHPVYNINNGSSPKAVYHLGSNPEFPFLRNLSTSRQVLTVLQNSNTRKKYPRQIKEINKMLKEIGFENGVRSLNEASITAVSIPAGTEGNMGSGDMRYSYVKMKGAKANKAWKISSESGCYITFFSKCGNAFYAGNDFGASSSKSYTGCKQMPVSISPEEKEITITDAPQHRTVKKTYIYYVKDACKCHGCDDPDVVYNRSRPLLIKKQEIVETVPQTYKISTSGTGTATVCNGKPTNVQADINVEKESEYTGYKPSDVEKEYIQVTKRQYKRMMRLKERERETLGPDMLRNK